MSEVTVATIKLFGAHQALDFTNTVNARGAVFGPDVLQSFDDMQNWGLRAGVVSADDVAAAEKVDAAREQAALALAKSLREAIYRIFVSRPSSDRADLDLLQRVVAAAHGRRMLALDGSGYVWRWQAADPDAISHRVALAAAELLTSPLLGQVHVCPGENCGWLFLDRSRGHRRLWCSEETCGTRSRVRRWRARRGSGQQLTR
jgi:predicted RNA-binding Zn ribbon-like protein